MNQPAPLQIMIIGIDSHFCYLMKRYLKRGSHHSLLANIGDNIITQVTELKPAAILLEVGKPGTTGWQILSALKAMGDTSHVPILAFTWTDDHAQIQDAGADLTVQMPILYEDFSKALKMVGVIAG